MIKRYIEVTIKDKGQVRIFPTVTRMYTQLGEEAIGITRNSLWNALAKNKGKYENKRIKVEYKERRQQVWR